MAPDALALLRRDHPECLNCGKQISVVKRPHAKYCNDKCRYEAYVKRQGENDASTS